MIGTNAAERLYGLLLLAYPARFRERYGAEMVTLFRDLRREPGARGAAFWAGLAWDVARSAPALRVESMRAGAGCHTQPEEPKMKPMAILAILIGALETASAASEGWNGGVVQGDARSLLAGTVVMVAGLLLLGAGVAMLRRAKHASTWAGGAAVTCLAVFAVVTLVAPRMSIFTTLLGIAFPIAMLVFLRFGGDSGRGATSMA